MDVVDTAPGPHNLCMMGMHRERIAAALARLPAVQREVIEMANFGGPRQSEIAVLLYSFMLLVA